MSPPAIETTPAIRWARACTLYGFFTRGAALYIPSLCVAPDSAGTVEESAMDALSLLLIVALAALTAGFVHLCAALRDRP